MTQTLHQRPLTEDEIDRRVDIVWNANKQGCDQCHRPVPPGVASDPAWFIDAEPAPDRDALNPDLELSIIRCPEHWRPAHAATAAKE